jgi:hypothetical protein
MKKSNQKPIYLLIIFLLISKITIGQVFTNSAGKGVFYTEKAKQFKLETKSSAKSTKFDIQYNGIFSRSSGINYSTSFYKLKDIDKDGVKDTVQTVQTSYGWLLKFGLEKETSLAESLGHPGVNFELGFIKSVDSLSQNDLINKIGTFSYGISFKGKYDNRKELYNQTTKVFSTEHPYSFSLDGHLELFFKEINWLTVGISGGYINQSNYGDLTSFQIINSKVIIDDNITSIPSKIDGKIGELSRQNIMYFSFSSPIFPFRSKQSKTIFNTIGEKLAITPFYYGTFSDLRTDNIGVSLSLTNNPFRNDKYSVLFDGAFSLGVDWTKKNKIWGEPIFFIAGTLSIDGIIKSIKEEEAKN